MTPQQQFIKAHWTQAVILGVVIIAVTVWQVIIEDTNIFGQQPRGEVKGEIAVSQDEQQTGAMAEYQKQLKQILTDYFSQRVEFDKPHQDWLFLINQTKYQVFNLSVPDNFKDVHLQVVMTLDKEFKVVEQGNEIEIDQISQRWQEILDNYFWLND